MAGMTMSSSVGANWSGSHTFRAPGLVEATTVDDVRRAVTQAAAGGTRVRALGTRHSFNDLADSPGALVSVTGIPPEPQLDEAARTVTVGGGIRYGVLARWLEERGWALHNLGSLPHISVAGATATGTHGSGVTNRSLSGAVAALELVDARGELRRIARGDTDFDGYVVGLGALGIVTRVSLDIEPSYLMRQDVYRDLPWATALDRLDEVLGFGYSVSLFASWSGDTIEQVWVKSRLDADPVLPDTWLGALRDPSSEGKLVDAASENLTVQGGVPGPWLDRLPHFRLDATPSIGNELQTEYFVARSDGPAALRAVRELRERITQLLLVTELRTIAADELWLSPAYRRESLAIHFTWKFAPDAVGALIPDLEAALAPFAPRPHWGKINGIGSRHLAEVYPRFEEARALFAREDPSGIFANEYLERVGLR